MKSFTLRELSEIMKDDPISPLDVAAHWYIDRQKLTLPDAAKDFMRECGWMENDWHNVIVGVHSADSIRAWTLYHRGYDPLFAGQTCPHCGQEIPKP